MYEHQKLEVNYCFVSLCLSTVSTITLILMWALSADLIMGVSIVHDIKVSNLYKHVFGTQKSWLIETVLLGI